MKMYDLYYKNDNAKFYELCGLVEKEFPQYDKYKLLTDVDGSLVQAYFQGDKQIVIINGIDWGYIFERSNVDLSEFVSSLSTGFPGKKLSGRNAGLSETISSL